MFGGRDHFSVTTLDDQIMVMGGSPFNQVAEVCNDERDASLDQSPIKPMNLHSSALAAETFDH